MNHAGDVLGERDATVGDEFLPVALLLLGFRIMEAWRAYQGIGGRRRGLVKGFDFLVPRGGKRLRCAVFFLQPLLPRLHGRLAVVTPCAGILGLGGIRSLPKIELRVLHAADQIAVHLVAAG